MLNSAQRITDAASEPVTLAEAKTHLRVTSADDDDYIDALILAARMQIETITGRALITQTWRASFDQVRGGRLCLPRSPLASVTTVEYRDTTDGTLQTASASTYEVNTYSEPGAVKFDTVPSYDSSYENPLQVTFVAGYGAADDVPAELKHALKFAVSHFFRNRSSVVNAKEVSPMVLPLAFQTLTTPFIFQHHE